MEDNAPLADSPVKLISSAKPVANHEGHPGVLPAAPAQGLPCPGTRKSLVWTSLFWIPAVLPPAPAQGLPCPRLLL